MSKKRVIFIVILIVFAITLWNFTAGKKQGGLVGTAFMPVEPSVVPTPIPTPNAPKTFEFDSSTDLEVELEKVNPQVLDSDFE